jgi:hypothetical protein
MNEADKVRRLWARYQEAERAKALAYANDPYSEAAWAAVALSMRRYKAFIKGATKVIGPCIGRYEWWKAELNKFKT